MSITGQRLFRFDMTQSLSYLRNHIQKLAPGQVLIFYYAIAILVGALLLKIPWAIQGEPLSFIDALFTATSAQCVTGLSVVDAGTRFTLFGQLVLLMLIQLGGLGITTFSVYLFYYLHLGVGTRGRWIVQETLIHTPIDSLRDLLRSIILMALVIEGAGALLLSFVFVPEFGLVKGVYQALFHSVSAFCNAGISLNPGSLVTYRNNPLVNITFISLIVLGGIGFLVIREVIALIKNKRIKGKRRRLSLHSRLVFWTTGILIVGGAALIGALEWQGAFAGMTPGEGFWTALFQSVTARTAGFNTINLDEFRVPTIFMLMFLMFVGASPGSTGGGIKTTSLALFFAILQSRLRGETHTNIFHRTIPEDAITKTFSLVLLAIFFIGVATFALLTVQHLGMKAGETGGGFLIYGFEAISAFATVGLSLGATAKLLPLGKLVIIIMMFVGRVGLLTMAFTIARRARKDATQYSRENVMIG